MPLTQITCPTCGAPVDVLTNQNMIVCKYCGNSFMATGTMARKVDEIKIQNSRDFYIHAGRLIRYSGESTHVVVPDNVQKICKRAFDDVHGSIVETIVLPKSVTSIEESAFEGLRSLKSITIPDSVTFIGNNAFQNCRNLKSIAIPGSVAYVGDFSFCHCTGLSSVTILSGVTTIGVHAFQDCISLKSITIPDSVTTIKNMAFFGCTSLNEINLPDNGIKIDRDAFSRCISLEHITIPGSVSLDEGIFHECPKLTQIDTPWTRDDKFYKLFFGTGLYDQHLNEVNERVRKKLCRNCGGNFNGVFKKVCSVCGRPKDY